MWLEIANLFSLAMFTAVNALGRYLKRRNGVMQFDEMGNMAGKVLFLLPGTACDYQTNYSGCSAGRNIPPLY